MDLEFKKLTAENVEGLAQYYGQRHDKTCDSVILDYFLWSNYYVPDAILSVCCHVLSHEVAINMIPVLWMR